MIFSEYSEHVLRRWVTYSTSKSTVNNLKDYVHVLQSLNVSSSGDAALLEAAKKGNLARVQKLAAQENINCRDTQGRNSTPLHLAGTVQGHLTF